MVSNLNLLRKLPKIVLNHLSVVCLQTKNQMVRSFLRKKSRRRKVLLVKLFLREVHNQRIPNLLPKKLWRKSPPVKLRLSILRSSMSKIKIKLKLILPWKNRRLNPRTISLTTPLKPKIMYKKEMRSLHISKLIILSPRLYQKRWNRERRSRCLNHQKTRIGIKARNKVDQRNTW